MALRRHEVRLRGLGFVMWPGPIAGAAIDQSPNPHRRVSWPRRAIQARFQPPAILLPRRPRHLAVVLAVFHDDGAALLAQELLDVVGAEAALAGRAAGLPASEGLRARPGA